MTNSSIFAERSVARMFMPWRARKTASFPVIKRSLRGTLSYVIAQERDERSREPDLLRLMCIHINATRERSLALKEIWGDDFYFNGRSMNVFVSKLRKYLKDDANIAILSVHGREVSLVVKEN